MPKHHYTPCRATAQQNNHAASPPQLGKPLLRSSIKPNSGASGTHHQTGRSHTTPPHDGAAGWTTLGMANLPRPRPPVNPGMSTIGPSTWPTRVAARTDSPRCASREGVAVAAVSVVVLPLPPAAVTPGTTATATAPLPVAVRRATSTLPAAPLAWAPASVLVVPVAGSAPTALPVGRAPAPPDFKLESGAPAAARGGADIRTVVDWGAGATSSGCPAVTAAAARLAPGSPFTLAVPAAPADATGWTR